MLKVQRMEIRNLGALSEVNINIPETGLIPVSGKNGSGKTTLLNALRYLWAGPKKDEAEELIKKGSTKAEIMAYIVEYPGGALSLFDDVPEGGQIKYIISRTITAAGAGPVVVKSPEGATYPSPASLAESFKKDLGLDPSEFARMEEKKQYDVVMKLANFDYDRKELLKHSDGCEPMTPALTPLEDIKIVRQYLYDKRKSVGVRRDLLESQGNVIIVPPEKEGVKKIDLFTLMEEEAMLRNEQEAQVEAKRQAGKAVEIEQAYALKLKSLNDEISETEEALASMRIKKVKMDQEYIQARVGADLLSKQASELPDLQPKFIKLEKDKGDAKINNDWAEKIAQKEALYKQTAEQASKYSDLTAKIKNVDDFKAELLAKASFPLPGLSVDDESGRVIFNSIPIKRLGECEQTIVGCSIAASLRPELRLIVCPHDILVDEDSRARWQQWCLENNFQVLYCDLIKDSDEIAVFIEVKDGTASVKTNCI